VHLIDHQSAGGLESLRHQLAGQSSRHAEALALTEQGERLFGAGDLRAAIDLFTRAMEKEPRLAATFNNLGVATWHLGNRAQALEFLKQANLADPYDRDTILNITDLLLAVNQPDSAVLACDAYLRLNPDDLEIDRLRNSLVNR